MTAIKEVSTFSRIPSFVPFGVLYFTQDTSDLYIGTGASKGPAVNFVGGVGGVSTFTINPQTGTTYTIQNSDSNALITFSNTASIAVSLPQAGTAAQFNSGWFCYVQNINTAFATITPVVSTINSFPSLTLAPYQSALIISDGVNYIALFTKIASTDSASSLSGYVATDAGGAAAGNQIIMVDRSVAGVNTKRKALNIYFETGAQQSGANYDGLQVNAGATVSANTSAFAGPVEAAEFLVAASGSGQTLPQINSVKARVLVLAGTTVTNATAFLNYLPTIAGTCTNYTGFELDSPTGGGTVATYIGVHADLNLSGLTITNAAFGAVLGGGTTPGSAGIFLNSGAGNVNTGAIVWGVGGAGPGAIINGIYTGIGSPNGVVPANPGSLYLNQSGGANTTLYVKESGSATNTGWAAK